MKKQSIISDFLALRGMGQVFTVTVGLLVLFAVFSCINYNFCSERNISNLLRQLAPILLIGIGQAYVLITGNIDLSIGSVVGMSCMISATLMSHGMDVNAALAITLVSCLAVGLLNGLLVAACKIQPFIATLGTMTVCRGIAQIVNHNLNTDAIGPAADWFRNLFYYGSFGIGDFNVYNTVWIAFVIFLVFNFVLSKTRTGRHMYAIGSNPEAAKLSGVDVAATTIKAYLVAAFCSCVVGLITCATAGQGTMDAGNMYEMYAVAAAVIGGVSTLGGTGLLSGVIVGAGIWGVLQNGLQFAGAPVAIRNIVIGVIVVISVLLDVIIRTGQKKAS
ncbi:MAG: ABC transporter permease [Abditibacteriota bacterium]|nr:ABC transporter permease [Abditibacteriota bacterium]